MPAVQVVCSRQDSTHPGRPSPTRRVYWGDMAETSSRPAFTPREGKCLPPAPGGENCLDAVPPSGSLSSRALPASCDPEPTSHSMSLEPRPLQASLPPFLAPTSQVPWAPSSLPPPHPLVLHWALSGPAPGHRCRKPRAARTQTGKKVTQDLSDDSMPHWRLASLSPGCSPQAGSLTAECIPALPAGPVRPVTSGFTHELFPGWTKHFTWIIYFHSLWRGWPGQPQDGCALVGTHSLWLP